MSLLVCLLVVSVEICSKFKMWHPEWKRRLSSPLLLFLLLFIGWNALRQRTNKVKSETFVAIVVWDGSQREGGRQMMQCVHTISIRKCDQWLWQHVASSHNVAKLLWLSHAKFVTKLIISVIYKIYKNIYNKFKLVKVKFQSIFILL